MIDERLARAALSRLAEPGRPRVAARASPRSARSRLYEDILAERDPGRPADRRGRDGSAGVDPARELEQAERLGIRFVIPGDDEWPTQLDDLAHAEPVQELGGVPIGLWVRGPVRLDELAGSVAVVGSRSATTYGERRRPRGRRRRWPEPARAWSRVPRSASTRQPTAAPWPWTAVGRGARVRRRPRLPAAHETCSTTWRSAGAVVSELPLGCAPMRMRFLARNRLIAALTRGTVLVEAAIRSGALNTADWADEPVPSADGRAGAGHQRASPRVSTTGSGRGAASLVTGADDVLEVVGGTGDHLLEPPRGAERPRDRLTRRHQQVLEAVPVASARGTGLDRRHRRRRTAGGRRRR